MVKTALITGITGQDGSYLAEFLLAKGYRVIGTVRSKKPAWPTGFNPTQENLSVVQMDLGYLDSIQRVFDGRELEYIDECYNLAAQSHVGYSFDHPEETYQVTGVGACHLMDEYFDRFPQGKFYQASTSELFGNRLSKLEGYSPESPYGVAKVMAHYNAKRHIDQGHFAVAGILYNHESPRRHESFVTQKICKYAVMAKKWIEQPYRTSSNKPCLSLGNIDAVRDWGYAPEYVEMMWKMLQCISPSTTMVIGTGEAHSVRDFAQKAYAYVGLDWREFTVQDNALLRANDVEFLRADPTDANKLFGRPLSGLDVLIPAMMRHQCTLQDVKLA